MNGLLGEEGGAEAMDVKDGPTAFEPLPFPVHPVQPRTSVFPDHPGPITPLMPRQPFDAPLTPNMPVLPATLTLLNKVYHFQTVQRENFGKLRLAQLQVDVPFEL